MSTQRLLAPLPFVLLIAIGFIGFGDALPKPLSTMSRQSRQALNQMISGIVPNWTPKTDPNKRTEDALEQENKNAK